MLALVPLLKSVSFGAADKSATSTRAVPGGELRMFSAEGKSLGMCPLKHTSVTSNVAGFVARVDVQQEFHNPSRQPIEAVYTFPLPHDAAVDEMTMTIGSRRIMGHIKRREEARKIYEAAKSAGKKAGLLDQERPNIFTQAVANILPGEDVSINISYVNLLTYEDGRYEFVFPTVVGPRFVTGGGGYTTVGQRGVSPTGTRSNPPGATDAERITPPIAPEGIRAGHDISLTINLDAGLPLREVNSELHPITIEHKGPNRITVRLKDGATLPNKDFILRYKVAGDKLQTGVIAQAPSNGDGFFSLILQPPAAPPPAQVAPKEMIFVIDQTGSQSCWPIAKAQ
jgi:Ca-activated chloride channel family protein